MRQARISAPVIAGISAMLLAGALNAADGAANVRGTKQFSANWKGGRLVAGSTGFQVVNDEGITASVGIAGAASGRGVTDARDGSVTFRGVSPGLGIRYYVRNGRPEYDFLVGQGARPEDIRLNVQTQGALALNSSGDLIASDGRSVIAFTRPHAYQIIGGRRCAVDASYTLRGSTTGFSVGAYDRTRELVIDPEVSTWSYPRLGSDVGIATQSANALATDSQGNVYATGMTASSKGYIIEIPARGGADSTYLILDSGGYTTPTAIAVDASGYIYVTGYANGANLPVTSGPSCCTSTANAFVLKFGPSALHGSTNPGAYYGSYFGGLGLTKAFGIAVNNSGIVWITGETNAYDFPHPNSSTTYGGGTNATFDGFAAKFDSVAGTQLYGRFLGGSQTSYGTDIAFDSNGVYFAGGTQAPNVPVTSGAWQSSGSGNTDGFFLRLNPTSPDTVSYGTYIQNGQVNGLALSNGHVYLTGQVGSGLLFKHTSGNSTASGKDAFVMQFDMTQATPTVPYSFLFGGSGDDLGTGIAVDSSGNAYVIGTTNSGGTIGSAGSLPLGSATAPLQSTYGGGTYDAFYAKFNSSGSLLESTYLGGKDEDVSGVGPGGATPPTGGIALASTGQVYLGGGTYSPNFPGGTNESGNGAFVVSLGRTSVLGDFNGDGVPDLIWQSISTSEATVHYYGGSQGSVDQGFNWIYPNPVSGWRIVAIADFNRDGHPDVVWQQSSTREATVHYLGGPQGDIDQGFNWLFPNPVSGWHIVGAADFNGDGIPDIVWQNDATRQATVHYMGGAQGNIDQGFNWIHLNPVPGWSIVGIADFNGDGIPDIVWQNDSTRQVTVHYMGGSQGDIDEGFNWLYPNSVSGWHIVGAVDMNGDGHPDIIWQSDTTGQATVHYFSGAQGNVELSWTWLNINSAPGWKAIVP